MGAIRSISSMLTLSRHSIFRLRCERMRNWRMAETRLSVAPGSATAWIGGSVPATRSLCGRRSTTTC